MRRSLPLALTLGLAFVAVETDAQQNEDHDLRRQAIQLVEDAYTRGDTASLKRIVATETFVRAAIKRYREVQRAVEESDFALLARYTGRRDDGLFGSRQAAAGGGSGDIRGSSDSGEYTCPDGGHPNGDTCYDQDGKPLGPATWSWKPDPNLGKGPPNNPIAPTTPHTHPPSDSPTPTPRPPDPPTGTTNIRPPAVDPPNPAANCPGIWEEVHQCVAEQQIVCGDDPDSDACTATTIRCTGLVADAIRACGDA